MSTSQGPTEVHTSPPENSEEHSPRVEEVQQPGFISRHFFLLIVLPAIILGLFAIRWMVASCGDSTSSFCQTVKSISNGISSITSPLVNAWRSLIILAAILGGLVLGSAALKGISYFGGDVTKRWADVKELQDHLAEKGGVDPKDIVKVTKDGKMVLVDPITGEVYKYNPTTELYEKVQKAQEVAIQSNQLQDAITMNKVEGKGGLDSRAAIGEEVRDAVTNERAQTITEFAKPKNPISEVLVVGK